MKTVEEHYVKSNLVVFQVVLGHAVRNPNTIFKDHQVVKL